MSFWKPAAAKYSSQQQQHQQALLREEGRAGADDDDNQGIQPMNFSWALLAQQRMLLPIYKHKSKILYALGTYAVVIIVGETGSGYVCLDDCFVWRP